MKKGIKERGGKEGEERGGRERKGRRSLTCNPQYLPIPRSQSKSWRGFKPLVSVAQFCTSVYLYFIHLFIYLSGLPVTFPALSALSCNNHKRLSASYM